MNVIGLAKSFGLDTRALYQQLSAASVRSAVVEQGLEDVYQRLEAVIPDISDQYTGGFDSQEYERYWKIKMRGLHAWQVSLMLAAVQNLGRPSLVLADIGDSSGNHARYLQALAPADAVARVVSVNLDPVAVDKVIARGGDAVLCRAEEMDLAGIRPNLFMTFEMVEHLTDPLRFLHRLAESGSADHLLMTVPWRRKSRFGGADLRMPDDRMSAQWTAEELHIFELCPDDWLLLARLAGWRPILTRLYRQYPLRSPLVALQPLWRALDFEGFWGVLLCRDLSVASRYKAW
jgi:hypothetical protein